MPYLITTEDKAKFWEDMSEALEPFFMAQNSVMLEWFIMHAQAQSFLEQMADDALCDPQRENGINS